MSGQVLSLELTTLISESKRKNPEIRTTAEKSLQDLKGLPSTSEQQLAADLSRRPAFVEPFLLACASRNVRLASSAIICLQRLVISKGLPRSRLKDVLDALNSCTALGLDIQLKILQALPALAQNYAQDLKGDHLAAALHVCAALQAVKTATISGVASATLQQLVVAVFEKVGVEDEHAREAPSVAEVPGDDGPTPLREAAFDAYRLFLDICLAIEGRKTRFLQISALPSALGLELIGACLDTHSAVFASHPELTSIIRTLVMPFLIQILSERQSFPLTLRAMRIVLLVVQQHLKVMPDECETVLGLLTHMVEPEASPYWKRTMCMEVFRSVYATPGLALRIYMQYDQRDGKKAIIRDNVASFVRMSTEKPALVGLGQQSSVPTGPAPQRDSTSEPIVLDAASGMAGVISTALGAMENSVPGISTQWSVPKAQCIDHLDKSDSPSLPETYIYSLVLDCLNSLSENLAKVILPLTVQHDESKSKKSPKIDVTDGEEDASAESPAAKTRTRVKRSHSYRARTVPINPLTLENNPSAPKIKAIAALIEDCWPALMATSSTFLSAALDDDLYRALIRSFQRFAQVSGLLRLTTARDAFLTTLGKAAVPPNILTSGSTSVPPSPTISSPGFYPNSKGFLGVDSIVNQSPGSSDKSRRPSNEPARPTLTTRNLLCLRALLNIAIAIGPTLGQSSSIILETLQQADMVLSATYGPPRDSRHGSIANNVPTIIAAETAAVEAAASRLFESTSDYPNDAFMQVLTTLCKLLDDKRRESPLLNGQTSKTPGSRASSRSGLTIELNPQPKDYIFVLSKIGQLADLNTARFASYAADESGWRLLVEQLVALGVSSLVPRDGRLLAADILGRCSVAIAQQSSADDTNEIENIQKMAVSSLQLLIHRLYSQNEELTGTDVAVHGKMLEAVRSILESCGETLVAGWDVILTTIGTVFEDEDEDDAETNGCTKMELPDKKNSQIPRLTSELVSPELGRISFSITQLICSDFLSSLPDQAVQPLVEILFHFATQDADVNVSLTTITLFFDVSNFLIKLDAVAGFSLDACIKDQNDESRGDNNSQHSRSSQWTLLLQRLSNVVADERAEVRNGAFQTIMRILSDEADDFSAGVWATMLSGLLFKILRNSVKQQSLLRAETTSVDMLSALDHTSRISLEGVANLIARYRGKIEETTKFPVIWSELVDIVSDTIDFGSYTLNMAVWTAITTMLKSIPEAEPRWTPAIRQVGDVWAEQIPESSTGPSKEDREQDAFLAYSTAATEIYRLTGKIMTAQEITRMAQNLFLTVRESKQVGYGGDANTTTPLQSRVLECLKGLRTDIDTVPSHFIQIASTMVALPFEPSRGVQTSSSPSFIAFSKSSMNWLSALIRTHVETAEIFKSGVVEKAIESLCIPVALKYTWKTNGRALSPWKKATTTALEILEPILAQLVALNGIAGDESNHERIWENVVDMATAIMDADLSTVNLDREMGMIEEDEAFDCDALKQLRGLMVPHLNRADIPDGLRERYARALFKASIVHKMEKEEIPNPKDPLQGLLKIRFGRVRDPAPSPREGMGYLCFAELVSVTSGVDDGTNDKGQSSRLAKASATWCIARFAVTIKAYIADQPLRGRMPMPLSMVEELVWCLEQMRLLKCEPSALEGVETVEEGQRMHIALLHPLIVKAMGVAGHRRHGNPVILEALQGVLEIGSGRFD